jgi:hypothetical protein
MNTKEKRGERRILSGLCLPYPAFWVEKLAAFARQRQVESGRVLLELFLFDKEVARSVKAPFLDIICAEKERRRGEEKRR